MKILQICNKVPFPPKDGGCIAMNNLTQGLIDNGNDVKVLAVNTQKHFTNITELPTEYRSKTNIEAVFVDTRINFFSAFINLFSNESYNVERFYSKTFESKLVEILRLESFDIVQLESLYVSKYIPVIRKHSQAKIVLRAHNIEHKIWEQNSILADNLFEKKYFSFLTKRLKQYEIGTIQTVDAIASITKEDETFFKRTGFNKLIDTFPFAVDIKKNDSDENAEEYPSVFHIGSMDWQPNVEGVSWFLKEVWEKVHSKYPKLKLYLAGRNMNNEFTRYKNKNVIAIGEVENSGKFMKSKGIMIVPLLSGGGMRVKIIEGMALGKTIVSTSIGAAGINYENYKNIIIADDSNEFVEAIGKCIADKQLYNNIGINAKALIGSEYNNADICKKLTDFYRQLLN